jgi:hypothetical protein
MERPLALCIRCGGALKRNPPDKCPHCGFVPKNDDEKARSLILSTGYEIDGELLAKTPEELAEIGRRIEAGTYVFDEQEVQRVVLAAREALGVPARKLIGDVLKWLAPAVLLLVALLWIAVRR